MEKTYKVSDIIFGTRSQYIEIQRKYQLLRELTDISKNKQVGDISYRIEPSRSVSRQGLEIIPVIKYMLIQNPKTLRGIIEYLKGQLLGYPQPLYYDIGKVLDFESNEVKNDIYIKNQEKYKEIVEEILQLDFLKKSNFKRIKVIPFNEKYANYGSFVYQDANGIQVWTVVESDNQAVRPIMEYVSENDSLSIWSGRRIVTTKDIVYKVLETKVDSSDLSDYQKDLIDNSDSVTKKIFIDDVIDNDVKFDIKENSNSIRLVKKK